MLMGTGQRACLLAVTVCGMALLAGLVAPYWLRIVFKVNALISEGSYTVNMGLIFSCSSISTSFAGTVLAKDSSCEIIGIDKDEGFDTFQVGRLLSVLSGVLVVLLGPITCCACCCCGNRAAQALGGTAVVAGLMGISGGAIFIYTTRDGLQTVGSLMAALKALAGPEGSPLVHDSSYFWACYVYMVACCLLVLLGIALVVLPGNKNPTLTHVAMPLPLHNPVQGDGPAYNRL